MASPCPRQNQWSYLLGDYACIGQFPWKRVCNWPKKKNWPKRPCHGASGTTHCPGLLNSSSKYAPGSLSSDTECMMMTPPSSIRTSRMGLVGHRRQSGFRTMGLSFPQLSPWDCAPWLAPTSSILPGATFQLSYWTASRPLMLIPLPGLVVSCPSPLVCWSKVSCCYLGPLRPKSLLPPVLCVAAGIQLHPQPQLVPTSILPGLQFQPERPCGQRILNIAAPP